MDQGQDMNTNDSQNVFHALDAITPCVTSQLQEFCSLAVNQLKQHPIAIETLQNNINNVSLNLDRLSEEIAKIEAHSETERLLRTQQQKELEERIIKIETVISTLPEWKENQINDMNKIKKNCKERLEQLSEKQIETENYTQQLENEMMVRIRAMEEAAISNAEVRCNLGDKIKNIGIDILEINKKYEIQNQIQQEKWEDQEAKLIVTEERINGIKENIEENNLRIEKVEDGQKPIQKSIEMIKEDLTVLEKEIKVVGNKMEELENADNIINGTIEIMLNRILVLEEDERIDNLMELEPRISAYEKETNENINKINNNIDNFSNQIDVIESDIENGHPEIWKISGLMEAMTKKVDESIKKVEINQNNIEMMQETVNNASEEVKISNEAIEEFKKIIEELDNIRSNETRKIMQYVDESVSSLAKSYEVHILRNQIDEFKIEVNKKIRESQQTVKFELLHETSPQTDNFKTYLKQQEEGLTLVKEQVEVMEKAMDVQATRLKIAELQLTETDQKIGAEILSEVAEIPKLKLDLQKLMDNVDSLFDKCHVKNEDNSDISMSSKHSILNMNNRNSMLINGNRRSTLVFNSDYNKRKSRIFQDIFDIKEQSDSTKNECQCDKEIERSMKQLIVYLCSSKEKREDKFEVTKDIKDRTKNLTKNSILENIMLSLLYILIFIQTQNEEIENTVLKIKTRNCNINELHNVNDVHETHQVKIEDNNYKVNNNISENIVSSNAFIPMSLNPPYNFYTKKRDILDEQERILLNKDKS